MEVKRESASRMRRGDACEGRDCLQMGKVARQRLETRSGSTKHKSGGGDEIASLSGSQGSEIFIEKPGFSYNKEVGILKEKVENKGEYHFCLSDQARR